MVDTGWTLPGTGATFAQGTSSTAWSNPNNIRTTSTSNYAQVVLAKNATSDNLRATNFSFNIPSNAIIVGIEAEVRAARTSGSNNALNMATHLVSSGNTMGANQAEGYSGDPWPSGQTTHPFGGPENLWGASLTPSLVNNSTFGFQVRILASGANSGSSTFRIYYARMRVYYEEGSAPGNFFMLFSVQDRIREILKPKPKFWIPELIV